MRGQSLWRIEDMNNPVVDCGFANEFSAYVERKSVV